MSRKIKLTGRGYESYTGDFCGEEFESGLSVGLVNKTDCNKIGLLIGAVDAETGEDILVSTAADQARSIERHKIRSQLESQEKEGEKEKVSLTVEIAPKTDKATQLVYDYTPESLGKIADEGGIAGLREFANPYDVVGRGISEIIDKLMALKEVEGK